MKTSEKMKPYSRFTVLGKNEVPHTDFLEWINETVLLETALQDIMHGTKDEWAEKIARNALENKDEDK